MSTDLDSLTWNIGFCPSTKVSAHNKPNIAVEDKCDRSTHRDEAKSVNMLKTKRRIEQGANSWVSPCTCHKQ